MNVHDRNSFRNNTSIMNNHSNYNFIINELFSIYNLYTLESKSNYAILNSDTPYMFLSITRICIDIWLYIPKHEVSLLNNTNMIVSHTLHS